MLNIFKLRGTRYFTAGDVTVEKTSVIVPTVGAPFRFYSVMRLGLGALKAGDVIDVGQANVQVSSLSTHNMMIGSMLILAAPTTTYVTTSLADWGPYHELVEAQTTNINNNIHHLPIRRTALWTVPEDIENGHLNFIVYAQRVGVGATTGTLNVTVDQDYGRFEVAVHREVTQADLLTWLGLNSDPAPAPEPPPPAPAPEPAPPPEPEPEPPAPEPEPEPTPEPDLITLQITPAQAMALQEVASLIPAA